MFKGFFSLTYVFSIHFHLMKKWSVRSSIFLLLCSTKEEKYPCENVYVLKRMHIMGTAC